MTIAEDQTEKEINIGKELEILENKIDTMYEENPDNPAIGVEEEKEDYLYNQLGMIHKSYGL